MRGILFVIITIFLIGLLSCTKENSISFVQDSTLQINDTAWTNTISYKTLAESISIELGSQALIDTITLNNEELDETTPLFNSNKYRLDINTNCLINPYTNKYFTKGKLIIKLVSLTSKADFVRNLTSTFLNNQANNCYGFYNLSFYTNDTLLNIDNGHPIQFYVQDSLVTSNTLKSCIAYLGNTSNLTDDNFTWSKDNSSTSSLSYWSPKSPLASGYQLSVFNSEWLTLAVPDNSNSNASKMSVLLPANFTNNNTVVYAVQNNNRDVARLIPDFPSRTFLLNNLPYNSGVNIVTLSKIDNQYYLGASIVNYNSQQTIFKVTPQKISLSDLISFLNSL